jgi:hypothetical protein
MKKCVSYIYKKHVRRNNTENTMSHNHDMAGNIYYISDSDNG